MKQGNNGSNRVAKAKSTKPTGRSPLRAKLKPKSRSSDASSAQLKPTKTVRTSKLARQAAAKSDRPLLENKRATPEAVEAVRSLVPESVAIQAPGSFQLFEMFPQGISVATGLGRPVLILKDQAGVEVLPVWMQPLDAGVALADLSNGASGFSPHGVAQRLMDALSLKIESCTFVEVSGHHQFVELVFVPSREGKAAANLNSVLRLRVRADEAMSFCLQGRARFFSSQAINAACRRIDADLNLLEQNLGKHESISKKPPYMM